MAVTHSDFDLMQLSLQTYDLFYEREKKQFLQYFLSQTGETLGKESYLSFTLSLW